jgi:hypothetical protein
MLMSFHYLLHVADSIKSSGPCWVSWQYPMERMCGMLLPLVHSKLHPYVNLANNLLIIEKINYLSYIAPAYNSIFIKNNSNKIWPQHRVFGLENYDEELYSPSVIHDLNKKSELPKLIYFYSVTLGIPKENIISVSKYYNLLYLISIYTALILYYFKSIDNKCIKYGRMRTKDGHYVGSSWIKCNNEMSRNNYCVAVNF